MMCAAGWYLHNTNIHGKEVKSVKTLADLGPIFPLIVPVYRFTDHRAATAYSQELAACLKPGSLKHIVEVRERNGCVNVSCPTWEARLLRLQDELFFACKQGGKSFETTVSLFDDSSLPKPDRNKTRLRCLVLDGLHFYTQVTRRLPDHLNWLRRVLRGPKECTTACMSASGNLQKAIAAVDGRLLVYSMDHGRLALFAIETLFADQGDTLGCAVGVASYCFIVQFAMTPKGVKINATLLSEKSDDPDRVPELPMPEKDTFARELYLRARRRFRRRCSSMPPQDAEAARATGIVHFRHDQFVKRHTELLRRVAENGPCPDMWRKTFWSLRGKRAMRRKLGLAGHACSQVGLFILDSFRSEDSPKKIGRFFTYRDLVRALLWDDALTSVEESWQMYILFQENFWEGGYLVSLEDTRSLFGELLESHPCSPQRRDELWKMALADIAPEDPLWDPEEIGMIQVRAFSKE